MEAVFYRCPICGNLIYMVDESGVVPTCCGAPMQRLKAKAQDMGVEKHLPVVERTDEHTLKVKIGEMVHPMTPEHHIEFICVQTCDGVLIKHLDPTGKPEAEFKCCKGVVEAVYEYCNLHGLWKTDVAETLPCKKQQ